MDHNEGSSPLLGADNPSHEGTQIPSLFLSQSEPQDREQTNALMGRDLSAPERGSVPS